MKKILLSILVFIVFAHFAKAQCTYGFPNNHNTDLFLSNIINTTTCSGENMTFNNVNSNPQGDGTLTFDESITFDSMFVNFSSGNQPAEFIIPAGDTLKITGDLIFAGQGDKDKFLTVEGVLIVEGNLDLGDIQFEIDGNGSISAKTVSGGGDTTCSADSGGTGTCPSITVEESCTGGGICGDSSLPIELKSFTASKSGKNIDLDWVTAKEENFSHFEIERSLDQENWSQLGLVQGMGESMSDVYYDFTDRDAPFGVIYYRLKSVDIDASYEYSPVVKIEVGFEGKLAVSPNPVQDASNLKIQVPSEFRDDLAYVGLFDLSGIKVQEFRNFNTDGTLQINQKLKAGMYILKVNHNGLEENIRVIVQ